MTFKVTLELCGKCGQLFPAGDRHQCELERLVATLRRENERLRAGQERRVICSACNRHEGDHHDPDCPGEWLVQVRPVGHWTVVERRPR